MFPSRIMSSSFISGSSLEKRCDADGCDHARDAGQPRHDQFRSAIAPKAGALFIRERMAHQQRARHGESEREHGAHAAASSMATRTRDISPKSR
jgi:hypothetical protein